MNTKKVNILAIVPYFVPRIGGGETHLYQLAELLSEKGHSITILTQLLPDSKEYEENGNIKVHRFGNALTPDGRHEAYTQILNHVKQNDFFDTVLYGYLSVGIEYNTRIMCEVLAEAKRKALPSIVRIPSSKRVTELESLHPDGINDLRQVDAVIALNPGIHAELISYGLSDYQIKRITNGVNINLFKPSVDSYENGMRHKLGCAKDSVIFLCPARFAPKKRIPDLLLLWKEIVEHYASAIPLELWVVGDDRLEAKQGEVSHRVQSMAKELHIQNLRLFPGEPHNNMPKYFQAADVYISMSSQEGMSNAMLEAMACGLPILAPSCDSTIPLIANGWNGLLFSPGDLVSAKNVISQFLNLNREERRMMGQRNREVICKSYRIEDIADIFSDLFNQFVFTETKEPQ